MRHVRAFSASTLLLSLAVSLAGAEDKPDDGFVPMFNGKDLSSWVNVNCHPGTFYVKDGMVITTGKPTGFLRTPKQYENFIADFEWMHVPPQPDAVGNSGFFVWADPIPAIGSGYTRGIEVQVLVNLTFTDKKTGAVTASSHGDLFSIWGATCTPDRPHPKGAERCIPSENRAKGANEWNHYRVEANDGVIKLAVNGKVVSGVSKCSPRKGYLALESEGSECRFRNLKIKELPSTKPKPSEIADEDKGFQNVYTGLDLANFKHDPDHVGHWVPKDWRLTYDGKSGAEPKHLYVEKEQGDCEFIVDWSLPAKKAKDGKPRIASFILRETPEYMLSLTVREDGRLILLQDENDRSEFLIDKNVAVAPPGKWNRATVSMRGGEVKLAINGTQVGEKLALKKLPVKGDIALMDTDTEITFANLFIRELK
jgi:hypothetical protein